MSRSTHHLRNICIQGNRICRPLNEDKSWTLTFFGDPATPGLPTIFLSGVLLTPAMASFMQYRDEFNNTLGAGHRCWLPGGMAPLCCGGKPCDKNCCCRERNCCSSSATTWIEVHFPLFRLLPRPRHLSQRQVFFQCQTWVWLSRQCSIGLVSRCKKGKSDTYNHVKQNNHLCMFS